MKNKTICVIGLGYVGLPIAALLANKGFIVNGFDTNDKVVSKINSGELHIFEPGLKKFVNSALKKNLKVYSKIKKSNIYIICVPTPIKKNNNQIKPDIKHVLKASQSIVSLIKPGDFIILESTSPVGTTKKIKDLLIKKGINIKDIKIAYCPERVLPGKTIKELVMNDRIVGGVNELSTKKISNFYRFFVKGKVFESDANTAEMCKLIENSYRDLNIAFANELSTICDKQNINVWKLIQLANKHPRVNILQPSVGVGGHCISIDPWFVISKDKKNTNLMRNAREVNDKKSKWVFNKIKILADHFYDEFKLKPKIICLGLSYKANIDDLRESKALEMVQELISKKYNVLAVEPNVKSYNSLPIVSIEEAKKKGHIFCVFVKHKEFLVPNIKSFLKKKKTLDFCGLLN